MASYSFNFLQIYFEIDEYTPKKKINNKVITIQSNPLAKILDLRYSSRKQSPFRSREVAVCIFEGWIWELFKVVRGEVKRKDDVMIDTRDF